MESNRCAVERVIEGVPPEVIEHIEKAMRRELLEKLDKILFSGQMVAIKIEREAMLHWPEGLRVRYTAEIRAVRQMEYVYSAPPEPRPYMKEESIMRRAARKAQKAIKGIIREQKGNEQKAEKESVQETVRA